MKLYFNLLRAFSSRKNSESQTRMLLKVSRMRFDEKRYHFSLSPFVIDLFIEVAQSFFGPGDFVPLNCREKKQFFKKFKNNHKDP